MRQAKQTIVLNGVKFAGSKAAVVDSLFEPGGTASGWYEVRGSGIQLFDAQGNRVGGINRNGVLYGSSRINGQLWHSHAQPRVIPEWASFGRKMEECKQVLQAVTQ